MAQHLVSTQTITVRLSRNSSHHTINTPGIQQADRCFTGFVYVCALMTSSAITVHVLIFKPNTLLSFWREKLKVTSKNATRTKIQHMVIDDVGVILDNSV